MHWPSARGSLANFARGRVLRNCQWGAPCAPLPKVAAPRWVQYCSLPRVDARKRAATKPRQGCHVLLQAWLRAWQINQPLTFTIYLQNSSPFPPLYHLHVQLLPVNLSNAGIDPGSLRLARVPCRSLCPLDLWQ